jgi:hypothetical protein
VQLIDLLISFGADEQLKNNKGFTAWEDINGSDINC